MQPKKLNAPPPVDKCPEYNGRYIACSGGKSYFCDTTGGYRTPEIACSHPSSQACPPTYPTKSCKDVKNPQHYIGVL